MTLVCRRIAAAGIVWALVWVAGLAGVSRAQLFQTRPELSGFVHVDEVDSAARAHLERVKAFVADGQWDEAVDGLRQVMETYGGKLISLTDHRYVSVTDYCQIQVAALPDQALALYRQRVDALAQKWYEEGVAHHDAAKLAGVVNQMFCSSWGDDALWTLGEIMLEQGDYGAARGYWEKMIERPPEKIPAARFDPARNAAGVAADQAALVAHWYVRDETPDPPIYRLRHDDELTDETARTLTRFWKAAGLPLTRLAYPETAIPLADIRARLVLTSILEGSLGRARGELEGFSRLHPHAQGALDGRKVVYAEGLAALLGSARKWARAKPDYDWLTFGGSPTRTKLAPALTNLGADAWPAISLGESFAADGVNSRAYSFRRPAEDSQALLSYHPIVVGNLLVVAARNSIFAFDVKTGKPAWSGDVSKAPGEIYSDENLPGQFNRMSRVGVPRYTLTAHGGRLYARVGSQVTNRPPESFESHKGYLVCLDLAAQGKLLWKIAPDDEKWAFEGSPLCDGENVYVAMRKSDVRPQSHVASFDAETGRLRWRAYVCSAETPGGGQLEEITHNLLTLDHGMLYCNTNLGAVAAITARDGQLQWATLYTRSKRAGFEGQRAAHFYRDLNPAIYYRGVLLVAPSDSETVFALDAVSGQLMWESYFAEDAVHLLGVGADNLIASGDRVWWIDVYTGKVLQRWPDTTPLGFGRGVLAGDKVLWPTRESLYVFNQRAGDNEVAQREPIALAAGRGATGGNLVVADGLLVIAAANKLYAFEQRVPEAKAAVKRERGKSRPAAAGESRNPPAPAASERATGP